MSVWKSGIGTGGTVAAVAINRQGQGSGYTLTEELHNGPSQATALFEAGKVVGRSGDGESTVSLRKIDSGST